MFVDLWLRFCCAKRQKGEPVDPLQRCEQQPEEARDEQPTEQPSTADFQAPLSSSQDLRQKIQVFQDRVGMPGLKKGVKTSLEMDVESVEGFLALSDNKSNKIASWELLNSQKQQDITNQLASLGIMQNSHHNGSNGSHGSNGHISHSGNHNLAFSVYNPHLAQTVLQPIQEHPGRELKRSNSQTNIKQKKIKKEKTVKKQDKPTGQQPAEIAKEKIKRQPNTNAKLWDENEDQLLRTAYIKCNGNWKEIAKVIPNRNMNQCAQRWRRLTPQQAKNKWSYDDDTEITRLVEKHGKNWVEIAKSFPGKTGKQIRERFLNKLDPTIKLAPWSQDEDDVILQVYKEHGPKWSIAAKQLQGRPENMVKNRFYSYIRRVVLGHQNPYQVVFNNPDQSIDSMSQPQALSMDQQHSFTASSMFSSIMDDDYIEEEDQELINAGQFKI